MSGPRWMTCPECKGRKGCGCLTCCGHGHVIDPASLPPARFDAPRKPPTKADLLDKIERRFKDGGASRLLWSDVQHLLAEARAAITDRARVAKLEAALREARLLADAVRREHDALDAYFSEHGAEHELEGCPENDDCDCPLVVAMNIASRDVSRARTRFYDAQRALTDDNAETERETKP